MKMTQKRTVIILAAGIAGAGFFLLAGTSRAATITWTAAGASTWNTSSSWSTGAVPTSADTALFSASSTQNGTIGAAVNVGGINIISGYTGTITQSTGSSISITVGSSGYSQAAGTFSGGTGQITVNGAFSLTGGTMTSTSGNLLLQGNGSTNTFSGTFNNNNGTVQFGQFSANNASETISGTATFNNLYFYVSGGATGVVYTLPTSTLFTVSSTLGYGGGGLAGMRVNGGGEVDVLGDVNGTTFSNGCTSSTCGGTATIALKGAGTQKLNNSASNNPWFPNITITKSSGSVTLVGTTTFTGNWTNTNGTTISPSGGTTVFQPPTGAATISGSSTFNNLWLGNNTGSSTFTIATGTVLTAQGYFFPYMSFTTLKLLGGGEIDVQGNIEAQGSGANQTTSTVSIVLNGTSTQILGDTAINNGSGTIQFPSLILPNLTINKTSGSVTLVHSIDIVGNWTNMNGTTINPGTSTLEIGTANGNFTNSGLFDTITGSSTFYNLLIGNYGNNNDSFTIATGTVLTAQGYFLPLESFNRINLLGGGEVDVQGNIEMQDHPGFATGTVAIVLNGTSTQLVGDPTINSVTAPAPYPSLVLQNLKINKTSGSVTLANWINISGNWTNVNGATINPGTSTVVIGLDPQYYPNAVLSDTITGSSTFYNLRIGNTQANDSFTIATGTVLTVQGYLLPLTGFTHVAFLGGGEIDAQGNIMTQDHPGFATGTVAIVLNGTSTQIIGDPTVNGAGATSPYVGLYLPNLTISKPSGLAYVANPVTEVTGNVALTSGELRLASSTATTTFQADGTITVGANTVLSDYATASSTINLGSSVTNNGTIFFAGDGTGCVTSTLNYVILRSTQTGTQRSWSGSGGVIMRYIDVEDQAGSASISVLNGTNSGNNGANWTFNTAARPQLVQSATNSGGSGTTQLALPAFGFWPRTSDLVVVTVSARNQSIAAPTDTAGNTYVLVASSTFGSSPSYALSLYYAKNVNTSSSFVVTVNGTSSQAGSFLSASAFEYTGMAPSSTFDTYSKNTDTSGDAVSLTTLSAAGTSQNELFFGATTISASTTVSSNSGWTARSGVTNNATNQALYVEDMATTSVTTAAAAWTSAASTSYTGILGVFHSPISANYNTTGTLDSATFDTGVSSGVQLNSLIWQGSAGNGTAVDFQFAVSNSSSGPWSFGGPDGTSGTYFSGNPGTTISLVSTSNGYALFSGYRYYRYRVTLFADPADIYTPTVNSIAVNWSP